MRAPIVYEAMYGNTRAVAETIAEGWGDGTVVRHVLGTQAPPADVELLVVGGPTHIHGMTTEFSRQVAITGAHADGHVEIEPDAVDAPGLRHWPSELPHDPGRQAAAFDTRLDRSPGMTGSAARGIAKRLATTAMRSARSRATWWTTPRGRSQRESSIAPAHGARRSAPPLPAGRSRLQTAAPTDMEFPSARATAYNHARTRPGG